MANQVHKMTKKDGTTVFRLWSSITDCYKTNEMNENELREQLLFEQLCQAIQSARGLGTEQSLTFALEVEKWEEENKDNKSHEPDPNNDLVKEAQLNIELAEVALEAIKVKLAELTKK